MFQNRGKIYLLLLFAAIAFYGAMAGRTLFAPAHFSVESRFLNFAMYSYGELKPFPEKIIVPVYPLLLSVFSDLPNRGIFVLRSFSLLLGIGCLLFLFRLASKRLDSLFAVFLVALVAADPFFTRLSAMVQPYTLSLFLMLVLFSAYLSLAEKKNSFFIFVGSGVLLSLSLPIAPLILFAFGLIALVKAEKEKRKQIGLAIGIWLVLPVVLWGIAFASLGIAPVLGSMGMANGAHRFQAGLFELLTGVFVPFLWDSFSSIASALKLIPATRAESELSHYGPIFWENFFSLSARFVFFAIAIGLLKVLLALIAFFFPGKDNTSRSRLTFVAFLFLFFVLSFNAFFQFGNLPGAWLIGLPLLWILVLAGVKSIFIRRWIYPAVGLLLCLILLTTLTHKETAGVRWKNLAERIQTTEPKEVQIVIYPLEHIVDIALYLQGKESRPVVRPNGFYNNGRYDKQDDFAAFQWTGLHAGDGNIADLAGKVAALIPNMGRIHFLVPAVYSPHLWYQNEELTTAMDAFNDFNSIDDHFGKFNHYGFLTWIRDNENVLGLAPRVIDFMKANHYRETFKPIFDFVELDHDLLASRMNLARQYLVSSMDCKSNCLPFFHQDLTKRDGFAHANWDWCDISSRYATALSKINRILGPMKDEKPLDRLQRNMFGIFKRDGLVYRWDTDFSDMEADIFDQGSAMLYLIDKYKHTQKEMYREMIEKMIGSMIKIADPTQGGLKFKYPTVLPDGSKGPGKDNWAQADPCHHGGRLLYPLALYLQQVPEAENAKKLFDGIAHYIRFEAGVFKPDGSFSGHTHSRTNTLLGLMIRAKDTQDTEMEQFVKRSVTWLVKTTPAWGWVPEFMPESDEAHPENMRAETDALVDLISILLILAKEEPGYWETIDRYVQNGLLQAQFTGQWQGDHSPRGAFCGFCAPNSFGEKTMNCCSPAGAGMLADLYFVAVYKKPEGIYINLLLDRDGPLVGIKTEIQEKQMLITLEPKIDGDYVVRLPSFVKPDTIQVENHQAAKLYASLLTLANAKSGDKISIRYDLPSHLETDTIGDQNYKYQWLGNRVISVEPKAEKYNFFE